MLHRNEVSEGHSCLAIDVGVALIGTPPRKAVRINFSPDHCHSLVCNLFRGLFREDEPLIEGVGQIVGVFKNR